MIFATCSLSESPAPLEDTTLNAWNGEKGSLFMFASDDHGYPKAFRYDHYPLFAQQMCQTGI